MSQIRPVYILLFISIILALASCSKEAESEASFVNLPKNEKFEQQLVINEIMASNHTGILTADGELSDWIEIKNLSDQPIDLEGYSLLYIKGEEAEGQDSTANCDTLTAEKKTSKPKRSIFHSRTLNPGDCLLVFASKQESSKDSTELHATFKLAAEGGLLQLLSPDKTVMSEVTYDLLAPDEVLRRMDDGTLEKSRLQTPGFDNTVEGYESYNRLIDKQRKSPLRIWEVMSKSQKRAYDWVEVKNVSTDTINLKDFALTDKPNKPEKWHFSDVQLAPNMTYVVQLAGKRSKDNPNKASFKLDDCETVVLTQKGRFADGVCAKQTYFGVTIGRQDSLLGFFYFDAPSCGTENTSKGFRHIAQQPTFSCEPGVYDKQDSILIRINHHGHTVHYTLDGSEPNAGSPVLKDSLYLPQTSVVRAYAEGDSISLHSPVYTATYFLGEKHTLPVMSISLRNSDLYDYSTGIYATGPGASPEFPHQGANYWKPWEKKAHVEFYDQNGSFSTDCGLKIFGGFSRASAKKSFQIKLRDQYGASSLKYDYFNEGKPLKLKNFVLRSGSQDDVGTMVRDEFFTSLMKEHSPTLLVQKYRPIVLYINGKYFGVYYIREKTDEHMVARKLHVSDDYPCTIIQSKYVEQGSIADFRSVQNFVTSHDMTVKANYDSICRLVDEVGLIDLTLGQMYSLNTDLGNVRYVRSEDPAGDKRWYWIYYDLDATWVDKRSASSYLYSNHDLCMQNVITVRLLKNSEFRKLFLERLSLHMHKTFSTKNTTKVFTDLINTIKPEMKRNCERWPNMKYETWERKVKWFQSKFESRNKDLLNELRTVLSVTPEEEKKYFSDLGY